MDEIPADQAASRNPPPPANPPIKETSLTSYLLELNLLKVPESFLLLNRKAEQNEIQNSDLLLVLRHESQIHEINVEDLLAQTVEKPFYICGPAIEATLVERVYDLKRDEEEFLRQIKNLNNKHSQSITHFLLENNAGTDNKNIDAMIKRKRIFKKDIAVKPPLQMQVENDLLNDESRVGATEKRRFSFQEAGEMEFEFIVRANKFISMPRGLLQVKFLSHSKFNKDPNIEYKDLIFRIEGPSLEGDMVRHQIRENEQRKTPLHFDTYFFDDLLEIEVYHKNSLIRRNMIGKKIVKLASLNLSSDQLEVEIENVLLDTKQPIIGSLKFQVHYAPWITDCFEGEMEWKTAVNWNMSQRQRCEFFQKYLENEFHTGSYYGIWNLEFQKEFLPPMPVKPQAEDSDEPPAPQVHIFMLKIKLGGESTEILMTKENGPLQTQTVNGLIGMSNGYEDRLSLELYEIKDPSPDKMHTLGNMKLLAARSYFLHELPLRDIPDFDQTCPVQEIPHFTAVLPILTLNQVASFMFSIRYEVQVDPTLMGLPIDTEGGMLCAKFINDHQHKSRELNAFDLSFKMENVTQQTSLTKPFFFNKPVFQMGHINIKHGDELKFSFVMTTGSGNSEKQEIVASFDRQKLNERSLDASGRPVEFTNLIRSWQPMEISFPINFNGHKKQSLTLFGNASQPSLTQQAGAADQGGLKRNATQNQSMYDTQKSMFSTAQPDKQQSAYLIENMNFELEYRTSDMIKGANKGHIDAMALNIFFLKDNVVDMLLNKCISENSKISMTIVSPDVQSLRKKWEFYVSDLVFDEPWQLQLYSLQDILQLKVVGTGSREWMTNLPIAEVPFMYQQGMEGNKFCFQVGTKQMKINLQLNLDKALLPQTVRTGGKENSKIMAAFGLNMATKVEAHREAHEFQKKIDELKQLPAHEQAIKLKAYINEQEKKTKNLITKQLRLKAEYDKSMRKLEQAKAVNMNAKPPAPKEQNNDPGAGIQKMLAGVVKTADNQQGTKKQQQSNGIKICACGKLNPQHKGYCTDCVKKLKDEFDVLMGKFTPMAEEFDKYTGMDQRKADEKLRLMKKKIAQYEIKLSENEVLDVVAKHEQLAKSEENRNFAEFRVQVAAMKQELAILQVKQDMKLKDLKATQDYLEMETARKKGKKRQLEQDIQDLTDDMNRLKDTAAGIDHRIVLKSKYIKMSQNSASSISNPDGI